MNRVAIYWKNLFTFNASSHKFVELWPLKTTPRRNGVLATNFDFQIAISLQPDGAIQSIII